MMGQLFLVGFLLAAGLFFLLADVLKIPTLSTSKAMRGAGSSSKRAYGTVEAWLMSGAVKVSKYIRLDEYKHSRMSNVLKAAGYSVTPEVYEAYAITKAGGILSGIIPCGLLLMFTDCFMQQKQKQLSITEALLIRTRSNCLKSTS